MSEKTVEVTLYKVQAERFHYERYPNTDPVNWTPVTLLLVVTNKGSIVEVEEH